ncbi:hypothetical protein GB937_004334 [Aspergillus fischeri]|nr:hypothetical protein GB937_004334 [Aspergillus fischeri]
MWSRYSTYLSQRASADRKKSHRDLLGTHSQSLGFRQLDRVKIDCSFMPDSKWGFLGTEPGIPAWLLYLQLQFSQPSDCKLASANIELTFEKIGPIYGSNLGPILTEYFGPRGVIGGLTEQNGVESIEQKPSIVFETTGVNLNTIGEGSSKNHPEIGKNWSLHGYTWPVDGDESGLHRRVEWIVKEAIPPHQIILHRDRIRVGLILQHDSEPFAITVRIEGRLQGSQGWFKFPPTESSPRSLRVRVSPTPNEQTPLDEIARRLDEDLTALIVRNYQKASKMLKRSRSDDHQSLGTQSSKEARLLVEKSVSDLSVEMQKAPEEYTIGWICALPLEMAAARAMLDEIHPSMPTPPNDHNSYILGSVGPHNIVVACLPAGVYGIARAAIVASQMVATFPSIRFSLMVGIGGGVPNRDPDIRLGDVVVSKPTGRLGGVVQYDYGKTVASGRFEPTGSLNKPPQTLLTTIAKMQAESMVCGSRIASHLTEMVLKHPQMQKFTYPGQDRDCLFRAEYDHTEPNPTCVSCDSMQRLIHPPRAKNTPIVHYGIVASGNQVMKHGRTRDRLAEEHGIMCFEMEAAGLMDTFPCLVIRGISDYADSHKNKEWQEYAAAAAAAYAKELLCMTPARQVEITPKTAGDKPRQVASCGSEKSFGKRRREEIDLWEENQRKGV